MKRYLLSVLLIWPLCVSAQGTLSPRPLYQPDRNAEQAREHARQRSEATQNASRQRQQRQLDQGTQRQQQLQQRDTQRNDAYQRRMDDASRRANEQLREVDEETVRRMQRLRDNAAGD